MNDSREIAEFGRATIRVCEAYEEGFRGVQLRALECIKSRDLEG